VTEEIPVVYVVDDDPSVRKALERLFRSAGHDAMTFASALEFLDFSHPDAPGCLVLDIKMPKLSGLELQERLAEKGIFFPIIFITGHGTVPASVRALKAGAMDFLQKPFEDRELLDAVRRGSKSTAACGGAKGNERASCLSWRLSPQGSARCSGSWSTGMLNKQVAFDLGTAEKTIKVHRARVMEKMGARSLADLVRFAEKLGIRSSDA
jgi:FixJ family two-component response regulator